jgi:hypothetical protein
MNRYTFAYIAVTAVNAILIAAAIISIVKGA